MAARVAGYRAPRAVHLVSALLLLTISALAYQDFTLHHNQQDLQTILSKWRTTCTLYSRWLDCSLLLRDNPSNHNAIALPEYPKLNNYWYKPSTRFHNVVHTPCLDYKLCVVTTPSPGYDGWSQSRQAPPSSTDILPPGDYNVASLATTESTSKSGDAHVDMARLLSDLFLKANQRRNQNVKPKEYEYNKLPTISMADVSSEPVTSAPIMTADEKEPNVETTPVYLRVGGPSPSVKGQTDNASQVKILEESKDGESKPSIDQEKLRNRNHGEPNLNDTDHSASTNDDSKLYNIVLLPPPTGSSKIASMTANEYVNEPSPSVIVPHNNSAEVHSPNSTPEHITPFQLFKESLDRLERKFLLSTFTRLTALSPAHRRVNGISFLQSGLFLHLLLISLSTEVDQAAVREIEESTGYYASNEAKIKVLKRVISRLPQSSEDLKFRWSSRLVLGPSLDAGSLFLNGAATAMNLTLSQLNSSVPATVTQTLNDMVATDSGGAMRATFDEEELSRGVCSAGLATLYVRARWRAAPTLLNGTRAFRDSTATRHARFFRVNDQMRYGYLRDWDAEMIEIPYATPGLSLLVVVPKEPSLGDLVARVARFGLGPLLAGARRLRAAVTLPLYTLRMTLLLPNKLHDMGMSSLVDVDNTDCASLKLSHAVQRLMFWAEAGQNAYKDDGLEWDPRPDVEVLVDRPYLFFVRWNNLTLINGNFVL